MCDTTRDRNIRDTRAPQRFPNVADFRHHIGAGASEANVELLCDENQKISFISKHETIMFTKTSFWET